VIDRIDAAKLIGYSGASGPANQALAALASYGLVERAGKGEMRVTGRARAILHPANETERRDNLRAAALEPDLFRDLGQRFPNIVPPEEGVITYLNRQGFNPTAVRPAAKAFLQTLSYLEELGATESHGGDLESDGKSDLSLGGTPGARGGAEIGDLIQWEIDGALQLAAATRVRAVQTHEGKEWVFVDGSETGISMDQVIVEQKGQAAPIKPPTLAIPPASTVADVVDKPAAAGARKEVFALDEGDVVLTFPADLSPASFHDLEGYLNLFLRKAQRRAGAGSFFVEIYAADGIKAKTVNYFESFGELEAFVRQAKATLGTDIMRVHLPSKATDAERSALREIGASLA